MSDMSQVIQPKSDQINADDLIAGPMTIEITSVTVNGGTEQPVSISFKGSGKVYRPCKSMMRVLVAAWGADSKAYTGRSLTLYRDPTVKWGGMAVGGIRISHMSHIEKEMVLMLTMTKQNRAPHKVKVLQSAPTTAIPDRNHDAEQSALSAARNGKAAFTAWWSSDYGRQHRATVAPVIDECKRLAAEFDTANPPDDDQAPM